MATERRKKSNSKKGLVTPDQKDREKIINKRTESSKQMSSDQPLDSETKKKNNK